MKSVKYLIVVIVIVIALIGCGKKPDPETTSDISKRDEIDVLIDSILKAKSEAEKELIALKDSLDADSCFSVDNSPEYMEGIYVTSYTAFSKGFDSLLDSAKAAGINSVVFDLKDMNGTVFCKVPDKYKTIEHDWRKFLNVKKTVKKIHDRGMYAIGRVVMFHNIHVATNDSIYCPSDSIGRRWVESNVKGPSWLDSSNPEVQRDLKNLVSYFAQTGIDEIQMDYIRFPTQGNLDNARFYFQAEEAGKQVLDSLYVPRQKPDIITEFVKDISNICRQNNVCLTADVFAIIAWQSERDIQNTGQNLKRMTKHLQRIHPMIYSSHFNSNFAYRENVENEPYQIVYTCGKQIMDHTDPKCKVIPYIQANNWHVNYTEHYINAQIEAVHNLGCEGYILWNAENNYYRTLRWLKKLRTEYPEIFKASN